MRKIDAFYLNKPLASAFVRSNRLTDLNRLVADIELTADSEDLVELYLFTGNELLLQKNKEIANQYFRKVILNEKYSSQNSLAESFYLIEDYKKAELIYTQLHDENPNDFTYITRLASCLTKNNKNEEGEQMIRKLESLREDYQFGEIDYLIAQYYATSGDKEKMFTFLLRSISQGNHYTISLFQNDPHFVNYLETEEFKSILNYWH